MESSQFPDGSRDGHPHVARATPTSACKTIIEIRWTFHVCDQCFMVRSLRAAEPAAIVGGLYCYGGGAVCAIGGTVGTCRQPLPQDWT
jgi:hypothetical protein